MNLIHQELRRARKEHVCFLCGGKITKGEEYRHSTMSDGGTVWNNCEHRKCSELVADLDSAYLMDGGEYIEDEFVEAVEELCHKEICPDCPLFDKEACECSEDNDIVKSCMEKVWEFTKPHAYAPNIRRWVVKTEEMMS